MMKKIILLSLLIATFYQSTVSAQSTIRVPPQSRSSYNPYFVPLDILISRPLGLAATIAGTAIFVATSPLIALTAIAPPHDAFKRAADAFIIVPSTYTFLRPIGQFLCPGECRPEDVRAAAQYAPYNHYQPYNGVTQYQRYDQPESAPLAAPTENAVNPYNRPTSSY